VAEVTDHMLRDRRLNGSEATYDEARAWAVWLDTFTTSDLADAMAINRSAAQGFMIGLMFNGTIADTGDRAVGEDGRSEPIYSFVPLPPGPKEHFTDRPPELVTPGVYELAPARGRPVFIEDLERKGRIMSTPGTRHRQRLRQLARERMDEADRERTRRKVSM
jgi:hypothetical protein